MTDVSITQNDGFAQTVCTGGETTIDFDFPIHLATHIQVLLTRAGVVSTLVLTTDYTIDAGSLDDDSGGIVTLVTPATAADIITCRLNVPEERPSDFQVSGDFFSRVLNLELDLETQMIQQLRRDIGRTARLADDSTITRVTLPTPEDGKSLAWDGTSGLMKAGPSVTDIMTVVATAAALASGLFGTQYNNYHSIQGSNSATITHEALGSGSQINLKHKTKGTTTTGGQYNGYVNNVLTPGTTGRHIFDINGKPVVEFTNNYWNPDSTFQDTYYGKVIISAGYGTSATTTDMIAGVLSLESDYYGQTGKNGLTVDGLTWIIGAKGPSGAVHFLTNGVIAHVNIAGISNPTGNDKYNAPQSALWFSGVASGGSGGAVITTQGTTGNGTTFYDASTGGYEFLSDNIGTRLFKMNRTALGVNALSVTAAIAGQSPTFAPYGTSANIGVLYFTKGTSQMNHFFYDSGKAQVSLGGPSNGVSYITIGNDTSGAVMSAQNGGSANPDFTIYTVGTGKFTFASSNVSHTLLQLLDNYNVITGNSAQATTDTAGFLFLGSCAGAPTGVPSSIPSNRVAWMYDRTNNQIYIYNGAWKKTVALT